MMMINLILIAVSMNLIINTDRFKIPKLVYLKYCLYQVDLVFSKLVFMSRRHKGTKTFCILCTLYFIHMHISIRMHGWLCLISIFPTVGTLNNLVLKCL